MSGNIVISFQRKNAKISQTTCDFLCAKLDIDEDEEVIRHIQLLTSGQLKKLKADDANSLLKKLLTSIIIDDNLDETTVSEIEADTDNENEIENGNDSGEEADSENDPNNTIKSMPNIPTPNTSKEIPSGSQKIEEDTPKAKVNGKSEPDAKKSKELCKFFKNGRCNKEEGKCRFSHPKVCRNFNQFGGKSDHAKGCKENCGFFHPNACRNSLKDKTCPYKDCRFFHLSGTKTVQKKNDKFQKKPFKKNIPSKSYEQRKSQPTENEKFVSKNRFSALEEEVEEEITVVKQVFQKGQTKITDTLAAIMVRLEAMEKNQEAVATKLTQSLQNHLQPIFRPAYLSQTVSPPGALTQAQWASQNQISQSQPQY